MFISYPKSKCPWPANNISLWSTRATFNWIWPDVVTVRTCGPSAGVVLPVQSKQCQGNPWKLHEATVPTLSRQHLRPRLGAGEGGRRHSKMELSRTLWKLNEESNEEKKWLSSNSSLLHKAPRQWSRSPPSPSSSLSSPFSCCATSWTSCSPVCRTMACAEAFEGGTEWFLLRLL